MHEHRRARRARRARCRGDAETARASIGMRNVVGAQIHVVPRSRHGRRAEVWAPVAVPSARQYHHASHHPRAPRRAGAPRHTRSRSRLRLGGSNVWRRRAAELLFGARARDARHVRRPRLRRVARRAAPGSARGASPARERPGCCRSPRRPRACTSLQRAPAAALPPRRATPPPATLRASATAGTARAHGRARVDLGAGRAVDRSCLARLVRMRRRPAGCLRSTARQPSRRDAPRHVAPHGVGARRWPPLLTRRSAVKAKRRSPRAPPRVAPTVCCSGRGGASFLLHCRGLLYARRGRAGKPGNSAGTIELGTGILLDIDSK